MPPKSTIEVDEAGAGERLDRFLADRLGVARNQVQSWIRSGRVTVEGDPSKASRLLAVGEVVVCDPPPRDVAAEMEPETGELAILFQDEDLVVIDKPAGIVVHPGAGRSRGTLAHRLLAHFPEMAQVGGRGRPGIVHRLDQDTTGVMVVARSPEAYDRLTAAFAGRTIQKRYLALVYGVPKSPRGRVERPIGRHPSQRKLMAVRPGGRPAITDYRCLAEATHLSLLDLDLTTGRTHQIRVHLKAIGHPLIGDPTYGEARWKALPGRLQAPLRGFHRPALHAWRLRLQHPARDEVMLFEAPVPRDLRQLWEIVAERAFPALPGK